MMKIKSVTLRIIKMSLKTPFSTHLGTVHDREAIIIEVTDEDEVKGYGEVVAFSSPWYTEETVKTAYHMLTDFLIPLVKETPIHHPKELQELFQSVRRNGMAKAGLDMAFWDLYAKQQKLPLAKLLGGERDNIRAGAVVGAKTIEETLQQIENFVELGYKRIKVKISPENDYELISSIREYYPDLPLLADANSSYTLSHIEQLKALDKFQLLMIEQPLAVDDIVDHAKLQQKIVTPICLDESIVSFEDARRAIELQSCKVLNIKIGRVGGISEAVKIHNYAIQHNIEVWCGGMLEFGISRAHNIALASLPGFTIPGDISASNRYWDEDITTPEVIVTNGEIQVPSDFGIGFKINEKRIQEVTTYFEEFQMK